jgi:DNA-binding CsgD family transcriptional regulator
MLVGAARGDDTALRHYEPLKASWPREALVAVNSGAAAIELLGARGDLEGMWRVHDEVVASVEATWNPEFQARVRLSALVLGQLCAAATRLSRAERAEPLARADDLLRVVESINRTVSARPRGFGPEGRAWVSRARAEHLRLRWLTASGGAGDLVAAWRDTVDAFDAFGHRHEAARSRARLASVLTAAGQAAEAALPAAEARVVAEELRARPLLDELRSVVGPRAQRAPARGEAELTPRETEILTLVAAGRSNGEIGSHLFISTKTVSVHVSNILAKLGAAGRTEAAAIARRRGLLPD